MIRLDLSFNKFKTLPACIKECHHLRYLFLDHCKRLQHIDEMPPNLEKFSAICCKSLTESSKSKVLYQALNLQTGKANFILPGGEFPENLDNYSRGSCLSFWVRDVFPTIFLWIVVKHDQDFLSNCTFLVHVNDHKLDIASEWHLLSTMKMDHLYICDLQSMIHKAELPQGNRWNHVKVSINSNTKETKSVGDQFHLALHVCKQQNNSDTIRFMDPRTIYADSNSWQRVQQPQDWEELEDDVSYRDLAVVSFKAQHLPKDDLKVKRAILPSRWTYDVFLSYRGDDECTSFVCHLFNSLCQKGIQAFMNDELLKTSGEELKEIKESRTAIIVISQNYASSPACLDSLATILECCTIEGRFIYPIFFDVEPLEVQHQTRSYGEVFAKLEMSIKCNKQKMQKWRLALTEAVTSKGFCYLNPNKNAIEDEYIIKTIIKEVSARIDRFPLPVGNYSVALESQVQEAISLVDVGSDEEVKMVGICGIHKSAIARAVCNVIARDFEDLWYFSGLSSSSIIPWTKNDLSDPIKVKFPVYEIARGYGFTLDDFHNLIRQPWFPQKKVLVVLDGVEVLDQLGAIRECDRFGEGSRIIVVTRDKQLLVSHGVEIIYDDEWNSALDEKGKNPTEEEDLKAKLAVLPSGWTYDVFLSYKSDEECSSFVRRLYNSLCQRGVRAFVNDELVKTSREILKEIQESRTSIIVFSKNYVSSPSCLNSLAIIYECFRMEYRFIYPIFYDVEPLELQHQAGSYGKVFARLGKIFKQHVQKWRLALSQVANSRGIFKLSPSLVRNATKDDEGAAIDWIIGEVSARLDEFPLPVSDNLVELYESPVQEVMSLVDVGSNEEVKMVGICGGRIRRSTMAQAVCNSIARHFEDLWYFHGVREIARGYASTWDDFQNRITQPWFSHRKILVILEILDGAEELDQLWAFRECSRFGKGSRIIVAAREKQLLVSHGIEIVYDDEWSSALDGKENDPNELLKVEEYPKAKRAVLPSGRTYDVFLSYRGDESSSFVSHLYESLCARRIHAFVKDASGETYSEEWTAIQESRTAIIVISKNYAFSPFCLESLADIIEYFRIECRFIYPIFYDVEPLELHSQTGSLGKVFHNLEKRFEHDKERWEKWRLSLSDAVDLSRDISYPISKIGREYNEDAIKRITVGVSARLAIFPLSIWDDSVELYESRVQEVISLVDVGSNEEVKMVGICCGGVRRSTIAHAVCNSIACHFEDLWYFHGVHEIARGYASTWDDFRNRITPPWFSLKKILVILEIPDGAEELDQLWEIRECDQFDEGSRIIVMTSDKKLLVTNGIEIIMDEIEEDPNDQRHKLKH